MGTVLPWCVLSPLSLQRLEEKSELAIFGRIDLGVTVIKYGETVDEVLSQIRNVIINAPLQADSDVGLVNPTLKIGKIFKANIKWKLQGGQQVPEDVEFEEVSEGNIGLPVTMASIYGDKPDNG